MQSTVTQSCSVMPFRADRASESKGLAPVTCTWGCECLGWGGHTRTNKVLFSIHCGHSLDYRLGVFISELGGCGNVSELGLYFQIFEYLQHTHTHIHTHITQSLAGRTQVTTQTHLWDRHGCAHPWTRHVRSWGKSHVPLHSKFNISLDCMRLSQENGGKKRKKGIHLGDGWDCLPGKKCLLSRPEDLSCLIPGIYDGRRCSDLYMHSRSHADIIYIHNIHTHTNNSK